MKCFLLFWLLPAALLANELQLGAGVQAEKTPYKGYGLQWSFLPAIEFESEYFYIRDDNAGVKLATLKKKDGAPFFEFSAYAAYTSFHFDRNRTSNAQLKQLGNRKESIFGGLKLQSATPVGLAVLSLARDFSGRSGGLFSQALCCWPIAAGPLEIRPRLGVTFVNSRYNRYYFGISESESLRSGLPAYGPKASLAPLAGLTADLTLRKRWELVVDFEAGAVPRPVRNSPMAGRSATYTLSMMFSYIF